MRLSEAKPQQLRKVKKHSWKLKLLGRLGAWLCDHFTPRPCTKSEIAQSSQYCQLMIDVLRGEVTYYGRDRAEGVNPIVAERADYARIYKGC